MACSNCNTSNCGCSGNYVVSQTCPPACSEVFNSACIVYTGVDISCFNSQTGMNSTVINRNDYLDSALTKIIAYFCGRFTNLVQPTTVVQPADAFVTVEETVSNSVTTYSVGLDIAAVAAAVDGSTTVVEAGGTNVTVDETVVGTVTTYTVTAQGTDVVSGDDFIDVQITQDQDDDIVTLTLDIAEVEAALGTVFVEEGSTGHVIVTELANFPTTGDTTYRLDSISTDVVSTDPILTVVQSGGIFPDYDQVFTLDLDDTLLGEFVMDTAAGILAQGGIIADPASAITVGYNALTHTITIGESIGVPLQWKTISDGITNEVAASPNDKIRIVADAVTDGITSTLAAGPGPNEATFTLVNEDRGSAQSTYTDFVCTNTSGGGTPGTCAASSNGQALNLVGGDGCDLSVDALSNTITIDNLVDKVYASFVGDLGPVLTADGIVDQLDVLGGDGIETVGTTGPGGNVLTIKNDGVITLSAGSNIIVDNADPQNPIVSTRANAIVDDTTVTTQDIDFATVLPTSLTHAVGTQYVQIRVIANTVIAGSINGIAIVADQDITSDFAIVMGSSGNYTLKATTFNGNVRVIVIGTI